MLRAALILQQKPARARYGWKGAQAFLPTGQREQKSYAARNVNIAITLPIADNLADRGRIAINTAAVISAIPITFDVA
jgi:hypothetical protein